MNQHIQKGATDVKMTEKHPVLATNETLICGEHSKNEETYIHSEPDCQTNVFSLLNIILV